MDKFEKYIKKSIQKNPDYEPNNDLKERVFKNANLVKQSKKSFLKRNWIKLTSCFACFFMFLLVGVAIILSSSKDVNQYLAIVEIDVNPKIEVVVNEKNEVTSLKGLNDEGKMIILEEDLKGKSLDEVLSKIIDIEMKIGYLNYNLGIEEMNVMVTAEKEKDVKKIKKDIDNTIASLNNNENINLKLYYKEGKNLENIKEYVSFTNPTLSDEKINKMSYDELIKNIVEYHNEVLDLGSIDLENMYLEMKRQNVIKAVEIKYYDAVNKLDNSYTSLITQYNDSYNLLNDIYTKYQEKYEELFINSDSPYQLALKNLSDKKEEIIKQKKTIFERKQNGENVTFEELVLKVLEEQYIIFESNLKIIKENIGEIYNNILEDVKSVVEKINNIKNQLRNIVNNITIDDILNSDDAVREFKKEMITSFNEKYRANIEYVNNNLKIRKSNLLNNDK